MAKKIIVLNGSPRKNGNTAALTGQFVQGAESAGHSVTRFNLGEMNVKPCIGCLRGGRDKESPCTQKDEMDRIYPAYQEADVIVLASPLYYWSFTAQLKTAIDRLFAVVEASGKSPREAAMLIAAEEDSEKNFQPVIDYYNTLTSRLGWQNRGMVLAGGVLALGDIQGKPSLEEARALGASL